MQVRSHRPWCHFVSAPVFGRPEAAAAAELYVIAAGAPDAVERCLPLFEVLGQRSFIVGHELPKGNLVKLSGHFLITSVIEALGETFTLVGKASIDRAQFLDLLTCMLFGALIYKTYGAQGGGTLVWSAMAKLAARDAGLEATSSESIAARKCQRSALS